MLSGHKKLNGYGIRGRIEGLIDGKLKGMILGKKAMMKDISRPAIPFWQNR